MQHNFAIPGIVSASEIVMHQTVLCNVEGNLVTSRKQNVDLHSSGINNSLQWTAGPYIIKHDTRYRGKIACFKETSDSRFDVQVL